MNAKKLTISMTPSQCRDPVNWRRSYYKNGRMTVMYNTCEPIQYSGNFDGNDGEDVGDIF